MTNHPTLPAGSEAELVRDVDTYGIDDVAEWGEPEPIQRASRMDVTISVRFSREEIAAVRRRAAAAGMKPTAYIRQCAMSPSGSDVDRQALLKRVAELELSVEGLRRLAG